MGSQFVVVLRCWVGLSEGGKLTDWHSLNLGVRVLDPRIVDCEHLVEGLAGELEKGQGQEQDDQADVVSCVALGVEALGGFPEARLRWRGGTHPAVVVVALGAGHLGVYATRTG